MKSSSSNLKQELDEYKLKATKTLAAKDRIIAQLKESHSTDGTEYTDNSEGPSLRSIEIEELKGERDYLKDELDSQTAAIELLRSELTVSSFFRLLFVTVLFCIIIWNIKELENQTTIEIETLKDQQRTLLEEQDEERQSKNYLEQDLKAVREQLDYAQEELYKQKSLSTNRIAEREAEIERLRNQVKI